MLHYFHKLEKKMYNLYLIVPILAILRINFAQDCTDTMSKENNVTVTDEETGKVTTLTDCKKMLKVDPSACSSEFIGGKKGLCCKTCSNRAPTCTDKLTPSLSFTLGDKKITSCSDVVENYKFLCKTMKRKGGACCKSCQGVNTKCLDLNLVFFIDNKKVDCKEFVSGDQCRCMEKDTKKACCESCNGVNIQKLGCKCRDTLSKDNPAELTLQEIDPETGAVTSETMKSIDNCEEIVNYFAEHCKSLGKKGKECCKSCKGVKTKCVDNLGWRADAVAGSTKCMNCNCHEIRKKSMALMSKVCNDNIEGTPDKFGNAITAKKACCLQCSRV